MPSIRTLAATPILLAVCSLVVKAADEQSASDQATVKVISGREFAGVIDDSSNPDELVVRSASGGITIKRRIRWDRIAELHVAGVRQNVTSLQTAASKRAIQNRANSPVKRIEVRAWPVTPAVNVAEEQIPAPVATVSFDSRIANWDGDAETDGVVIDVAPLDPLGNLLPLGGTLEVELFAPQRRVFDQAPQAGGASLEVVERWTRAITPDQYGPGGARLQLPFGAITPELQPNLIAWHYGLVHARLSIPGHGVFDQSRDGVRVRPWAPSRDRLELQTGQRFLPTENLGRRD